MRGRGRGEEETEGKGGEGEEYVQGGERRECGRVRE